jgi:hypothetical protein
MRKTFLVGLPTPREIQQQLVSYREYNLPIVLARADDLLQRFLQYLLQEVSFQRYEMNTGRITYVISSRVQNKRAEVSLVVDNNQQTRLEVDTFPVGSIAPQTQEEQQLWQEFMFRVAEKWIEKNDLRPSSNTTVSTNIVRPETLSECIDNFVKYITSDVRMSFWRLEAGVHRWVSRPEQHAKLQLFAFLRGSYKSSALILEEVKAGAGRIDLFIMLPSKEMAIIELKMCGSKYSLNYAQNGLEQVRHYMKNKEAQEGYLLIFDARIRDFGKSSIVERLENIKIITVDVRPNM